MRHAAAGDTGAFETIFERFHQELYRYCRALLSDPDEAQDALQNTMAAALRALPGEERAIALRPWLYRIAHNEAMTMVRRRPAPAPAIGADDLVAPSAQVGLEQRERMREMVSDLSALPDRQRGALVMRELSGLSYAEIASALGSAEGTARQTVHEAREAMRESKRGREMDCTEVRQTISERDGRMLRGRAVRAHMSACEGCQDFKAAITERKHDFQLISPPIGALAAASVLGTVLGKGGGASAGLAGGAGGAAAGGGAAGAGITGAGAAVTTIGAGGSGALLAKGGAVIAALAIGAGAADATGTLDLPLLGKSDDSQSSPASPGDSASKANGSPTSGSGDGGRPSQADAGSKSHGQGNANGHSNSQAGQHGHAGERGNGSPSLGQGTDHALPDTSQGASPPGTATGNPHVTGAAPGSSATGGPPANSNAGGAVTPPANSNAGGGAPSLPTNSNAGGNGGNPRG
jgi:RNA polymerase sigma factor (sigma-70 family)